MKLSINALFCAAMLLTSTAASAVELSQATDQQLLAELSIRLGQNPGQPGGSGFGILIGACSGGDLTLSIITETKNEKIMTQWIGTNCNSSLQSIKGKLGRFEGLQVLALCSGGDLKTIAVNADGLTNIKTDWIGTSCQKQADAINAL